VIGTLLGFALGEGVVEITNSFPVPHTETEQVAVDMDFHRNMYELHHRASPREIIVGWYATGSDITESSVLLHDFYWKEMNQSPLHLTIDTTLQGNTMAINSYMSNTVSFGEKQLIAHFQPIPHELKSFEAEKITVETLTRAEDGDLTTLLSELQTLEQSMDKLQSSLQTISEYVDKVTSGKIKPDNKIGRFLWDAVSELPKVEGEAFDKMFNNSIQDVLMVVYLANLTRTQLAIAEKLQNVI